MVMLTSVSWPLQQLTGRYLDEFKERFGVPETRGYYRSTGGLVKFDNRDLGSSGTGMVGYTRPTKRAFERCRSGTICYKRGSGSHCKCDKRSSLSLKWGAV